MRFLIAILLLFVYTLGFAQEFEINDKKKVKLKFEYLNNLILIPVQLNGKNLTFLLDSGVQQTLLFSVENEDLSLENIQKMKFTGLGGSVEIEGYESKKNILKIHKDIVDNEHTIYFIPNADFNISDHIGIPVHGIIGYQFFKSHPIKIDYVNHYITFYNDPKLFQKEIKRKYEQNDITIELNKPYIYADVQQIDEKVRSKMLIDLGNSDPIWLFPSLIENFVYNRPNIEDFLGRGFNGDIYGKRSRIHSLQLSSFVFNKPMMAMPDEYSIQHLKLVNDRKGSIGNEILKRMDVILDYSSKHMYFRKNKNFNEPFHTDMSGLSIRHDGLIWTKEIIDVKKTVPYGIDHKSNTFDNERENLISKLQYNFVLRPIFSVAGVRANSPAQLAGLQKGDQIQKINGQNINKLNLNQINELLKHEEGDKIKIEILRNGVKYNFMFILQDPIPFQN